MKFIAKTNSNTDYFIECANISNELFSHQFSNHDALDVYNKR